MGKIRIKTLGVEEFEEKEKKRSKEKQEAKKRATTESTEVKSATTEHTEEITENTEKKQSETVVTGKTVVAKKRSRSKRYKSAKIQVEKKSYPLSEAIELLKKLQKAKFDETVELHVNTAETGISGNLTLPHGTGKKVRVAIASDELIAEVEKGKIDFDILVAEPSMMPKLAKVAKILGPRGLMPNPKNGTITTQPQEAAKKYESGQIRFKTEAKTPVIHLSVGKISFGGKKLSENIKTVLSTIQSSKIRNVTLKSTMSPGIRIDTSS